MSEALSSSRKITESQSWREWSLATAVSFCVALAVVVPFFKLGTASGHDIAFHMASWLDTANQWKQGVIFPRWAEWANFGFGEPRFVFYPPLSWMMGAFLGKVVSWESVSLVFNLCVQTFAGVSAYALLRNVVNTSRATLIGAACFAANPYALLIVYMRSDFAELLAIAIFPVLLLTALRVSGAIAASPSQSELTQIFLFAVCFCAVWLSNAPAAVIATYSMGLLFAFAAVRQLSLRPLWRGGAGMALGFCLAAFYLIPAIYEQRWVNISGALAEGLKPADNFLFAKTVDAEHDAFNHIASWMAVVLMVWTALAVAAAWRSNLSRPTSSPERGTLANAVTLAAIAVLFMLPITAVGWQFLPEVRFVQFPWRWMSVLAVCAMVATAISACGRLRWVWPVALTITLLFCGRHLVRHAWWDTEDMPTLQVALNDRTGFEGTDEYDPIGDDHSALPEKSPKARIVTPAAEGHERHESTIKITEWRAELRRIAVTTSKPAGVAVRLLNYPAWRVAVNGRIVAPQTMENSAQMVVPVAAGFSDVRIEFTRTADRTAGGWISTVSLMACALALVLTRKRRKSASA